MVSMNNRAKWIVWIILLFIFLYLSNVVMPGIQDDIIRVADKPGCVSSLDTEFGFTKEVAFNHLDCMGRAGRSVYDESRKSKDSIYPVSYGLFFSFTLFSLSSLLFRKRSFIFILTAIPVAGMLFDFFENEQIGKLIAQFPDLKDTTVTLASAGNIAKWSFDYLSIGLILALSVWVMVRTIKGRHSGQ